MSDKTGRYDDSAERLDYREIGDFFARRWKLIAGTGLCFGAAGLTACFLMTPVFTATSQILLDPPRHQAFEERGTPREAPLDSSVVDSQIPLIVSTKTLWHVVKQEVLADDPEFGSPATSSLWPWDSATASSSVPQPEATDEEIPPAYVPVIKRLSDHIEVTRIGKSNVLTITVTSRVARKAMHLANVIAGTYAADQVGFQVKAIQRVNSLFEERLAGLRKQVHDSESAIAEFRTKNGLTTTTDEKVTVSEQQVVNLNDRLASATSDAAEKLAKYQQTKKLMQGGGDPATVLEVMHSPVIAQLRAQQAEVKRREAELLASYGSSFPEVIKVQAERESLDRAVSAETARLFSMLKNDYDVAKSREESLRKDMSNLMGPSGGDGDTGVKLRELERTNKANKALFENFLNSAKVTQEKPSFEVPDARLISPALTPSAPSSPKPKLVVPVTMIAGMICGLLVSIVFEHAGGSHATVERVAPRTRRQWQPLIAGHVPYLSSKDEDLFFGVSDDPSVAAEAPPSRFAYAIDQIATRLSWCEGKASQVMMISPQNRHKGGSFLARCLTASFVRMDKKVLLIDADNVHASLTAYFNLGYDTGLGDIIAGSATLDNAALTMSSFTFLPLGRALFDLSDRPVFEHVDKLLKRARAVYDIIIIDGPSLDGGEANAAWTNLVDCFAIVAGPDLLHSGFEPELAFPYHAETFQGFIINQAGATDASSSASYAA